MAFPRTVPQAEALDELLRHKHLKLDAVIELRVNESALLSRVETRVAEMRARGEEVRVDDTPEVLSKRLASYRALTEPLIHYYSERRKLLTVDGMMTIEEVTREINRILGRDRGGDIPWDQDNGQGNSQGSHLQTGCQEPCGGRGALVGIGTGGQKKRLKPPKSPPRRLERRGEIGLQGGQEVGPPGRWGGQGEAGPASPKRRRRKWLKRSRNGELRHRNG